MRSLSATLRAAQATHTAPPAVSLVVDDRYLGAPRYHFTTVRDVPGASQAHAAACCWSTYLGFLQTDAALVPYFHRFAAGPTPGAPLSVSLGGALPAASQVALIHDGTVLRAFGMANDLHRIVYKTSADNGATWDPAWGTVHDFGVGYSVSGLAAVATPGTYCTWILLVAVRDIAAGTVAVHTFYDVAGLVSGPFVWPRAAAALNEGLATVYHNGAANFTQIRFFFAGQCEGSTTPTLSTYFLQVSAGGRFWTYHGSTHLGQSPGYAWRWPAAAAVPTDRTYVLVQETSPSSTTYPVLVSILPGTFAFTAPGTLRRPLTPEGTLTLALAASAAGVHAGHPGHIRHAPAYTAAARVDLTQYLISYDLWEPLYPWEAPRLGTIVLGAHSDYLALPSALDIGAMLTLREGYQTGAGAEYSTAPQLQIAQITRDPHTITLGVYDALGALGRAPAQFTAKISAGPASTIIALLALVGLPYTDDSSPNLYAPALPPTYLVQSGAPLLATLRRILEHTGTALLPQAQEATLAAYPALRGYAFTPGVNTAGAYAFGPSDHRILSWQVDDAETPTWFIALHQATYAEAIDYDTANRLAFARQVVREEALTDHLTPSDIAPILADRYAAASHVGRITTRPHVGAEPGDVVEIDAAPLTGYRRILAIRRQYQRTGESHGFTSTGSRRSTSQHLYEHTYTLGALPPILGV